jgi:hypothetical protein
MMRHIIYCALLIATWLCSTASVIWVLNFGGLNWMLVAGACFASFVSSVALVEELVEWHRHPEASPVQRELLPPAS